MPVWPNLMQEVWQTLLKLAVQWLGHSYHPLKRR